MDCSKRAYDYLKKAILKNEIEEGTPIREVEIAQKLQISRTPIREALRQLEIEGIVVNYRSRGCFVSTISPYDVEEIYELRTMFELYALEKAFPRITQEDLDRLEKSFLMSNEHFDWEQYHAADRAFHQLFFDKCGNRRAVTFMTMLNTQIERIRNCSDKYVARSVDERLKEHLHIIKCMRQQDLDATREALKIHLRKVSNAAIETCRMMGTNLHEN